MSTVEASRLGPVRCMEAKLLIGDTPAQDVACEGVKVFT